MIHKLKLLLTFCLIGVGCKDKPAIEILAKCIEEVHASPNVQLLPDSSIIEIRELFEFNKISLENLQFYEYHAEPTYGFHVNAYRHHNKQKIFTGNITYHFQNDKTFTYSAGNNIKSFESATQNSTSKEFAASVFLTEVKGDRFYDAKNDQISNGCISVELGYYNIDFPNGGSDDQAIRVWKVSPKNSEYPVAYVSYKTGALLLYTNGILNMH